MAFYFKKHGKDVYALCDKELIGKILREGDTVIDLNTYKHFYIGELKTELSFEDLEDFSSINAIGKKSISQLMKLGLLKQNQIKYIENIPYVIIIKIKY